MIELGKTYRDIVTGFEGVATGAVTYLTGCNQALLAPKVGADGARPESQWFDEQRLVDTGLPAIVLPASASNGPDRPAPRR